VRGDISLLGAFHARKDYGKKSEKDWKKENRGRSLKRRGAGYWVQMQKKQLSQQVVPSENWKKED